MLIVSATPGTQDFLRAASITARPTETGMELIEWSIVAVPADSDAVRSVYRSALDHILPATLPEAVQPQPATSTTEDDMTEEQVAAVAARAVEQALAKRDEEANRSETIKTEIRDALAELGLVAPGAVAPGTVAPEAAPTAAPAAAPTAAAPTAPAPAAPAAPDAEDTQLTPAAADRAAGRGTRGRAGAVPGPPARRIRRQGQVDPRHLCGRRGQRG